MFTPEKPWSHGAVAVVGFGWLLYGKHGLDDGSEVASAVSIIKQQSSLFLMRDLLATSAEGDSE
jgi:hypothetical protein